MATSAQFTAQPIIDIAQISTANTNRDGTGTLVTVAAGPTATAANGVGKRINRVVIHCTGNNSTNIVRFFISTDNGTTNRLVLEKYLVANTASTTNPATRIEVPELNGLILPGGNTVLLRAATNNAETYNVLVESGLL
jgi:hypothetical protein